MNASFRKLCLHTAHDFYRGNIADGISKLETIVASCTDGSAAIPYLEPLLDAIDAGNYNLAADILFYYISVAYEQAINNPLNEFVTATKVKPVRFLIYEFAACMQSDLELILDQNHIQYDRFSYLFYENYYEDPFFIKEFSSALSKHPYTAVISMNYWPLLAEGCHKANIPYISWIYDCPMPFPWDSTIHYDTNHAFVFDQTLLLEAYDKGYANVDFIPLAENCPRIENIRLTTSDQEKYDADVSFVGKLYESNMHLFRPAMTDQESTQIDSLIEKQLSTYGSYFLENDLTKPLADVIYDRYEAAGNPPPKKREFFPDWFDDSLSFEVTYRERTRLMRAASEQFKTKLYSTDSISDAPSLINCGAINNGVEMYKMFKASKINLNITFRRIKTGIPLRILDILGAEAFLLTNYQKDLDYYFRPGTDFIVYESINDAIEKIRYYLNHEDERLQIAKNGHEAVKRLSYERVFGTILLRSLS